jgi:hypothetical protein
MIDARDYQFEKDSTTNSVRLTNVGVGFNHILTRS